MKCLAGARTPAHVASFHAFSDRERLSAEVTPRDSLKNHERAGCAWSGRHEPALWSGTPAMAAFFGNARNVGPAAGTLDRILDNDLAGAELGTGRRARCRWRLHARWRGPCRFIRLADK